MAKTRIKKVLSVFLSFLMVLSCWVWADPGHTHAHAATEAVKDKYLFAYFTGNSSDGQTVHLAVSEDGLHYTALRNNDPVIIPSKGTGAVRDPYIWYNEQDNYYYLICTDMDSADNQWWDNCNGFLMWRSKDLVHWYDETFINVYDLLQNFNQKVGIVHRAWAPQILWDGQSYIVYFSIDTDNVNYPADQLSIVYFKTTDLMDLTQYYEYGGILYPGFDVNDADIIQHPTNGKWYLFYKPENGNIKINMMESDNATGPYTSADPSNAAGLDVFSTVNEALEGGNGYFDNAGNFVLYADAYGHGSSYFYIAKTPATGDFKTWTVYGEDAHNINSLSPRHGSVVKITGEEYNRLLNNAYGITSSSFPATETTKDHLVGRYFTTTDPTYNAANGKNDLTIVNGMSMNGDYMFDQIGYYGYYQGSNYAKINLNSLIPGGLNYDDGFTITFTARVTGNADSRFFALTNGSNTTNFAVNGSSSGAYVVNNNGTQKVHTTTANLADGALHDYIISYANGNIIIYKDGELLLKKNRFNDGTMTEAWYDAISNGTLYIGALADNSGVLVGGLADFCIYDCSMSYYDVKTIQNEHDLEAGITGSGTISGYTPPTNAVPAFRDDEGTINSSYYANILYSPKVEGTLPKEEGEDKANPDSGRNSAQAAVAAQSQYTNVGIYYSKNTVMFVDGLTVPKMPVMIAARLNKNNYDSKMIKAYPSASSSSTADSPYFYLTQNWYGWTRYPNFTYAITNPDGSSQRIGHNSSTNLSADLDDGGTQGARSVYYYASVLALNEANVTFNSNGYQKYDPPWYWEASTSGSNSSSGNASSNESSSQHGTNHAIWVIDLRAYAAAKNQIASEYDSIVKNSSYCPATVEAYKSVVEQIMQFNPNSFNYAGGVEAAVKACSTQAQQLVNDYNVAKANLGDHKTLTIPAREATCAAPGLTEGSYCEYCGEIYAEQTVTEKLPHTFGGQFTENGVDYYVQCSVCGLKLLVKQNEVRFENLFSLNKWFETDSKTPNSGAINVDFVKDTITFANGSTTTESVSAASGNVSRSFNLYAFPVDPSTTYVLEYALTSQDATSDIFVFYYDNNGNHVGTYGGVVSGTNGASQVYNYTFTPVANAAFAELRFDSNDPGETVRFSNIGVYTQESYNTFAKENPYSRVGFSTGEAIELFTPKRIGYEFLGWYTANGTKITNTNQLDASATVYARWREVGNSVLYNGNLFSLTEFAKTNDYNMNGNAFDGHVWVDFENETLNTLSPREGLGKASLSVASQLDVYNTPGTYKVPVTAGKEYVYTATHASKSAHQTYLWFYDASGGAVNHPATGAQWIHHGTNKPAQGCVAQWYENTLVIRFTVPDGATHMSFRMGTTGAYAFTQTFSNIGLYAAEDYDNFVGGFIMPTQTYVPDGENVELAKAERLGYALAGWYENKDLSGSALTNTSSMTADKTVYAKWEPTASTLTYDVNGGSMTEANTLSYKITDTITLPTPTRTGYTFRGWKVTTGAGNWVEDGVCNGGDVISGMSGNATLTAQWTVNDYTISFDNLIDFNNWNKSAGNGTVSNVTENGFTITSNSGVDEATSSSPYFAVKPGESYKIDVDITGNGWDVYIFFCDENGSWIDFADGESNRFSSDKDWDNIFTAPNNSAVVKAQIRLDANGSNNTVTFDNIRVYKADVEVADGVSYVAPITKTYGTTYGTLPTPTRTGYTFNGWFLEDGTQITADTNIYADNIVVYSKWTAEKYTVTWVVDGNVTTEKYDYGTVPSFKGETAKAADAQYTYTFKGWDKELSAVTDDVTYTAQYDKTVNNYTVTWKVDGKTTTETYAYGATPTFKGTTDKAADAQYTYTFTGWDKALAVVTEDATYTAQYSTAVNKYVITFENEDGTVLQSIEVAYGETPAYTGATPQKAATAEYTYTFKGWDPAITTVTGTATYTAQFDSTVNEYTITWVDGDGNTLKTEKVAYGETPAYTGDTPTKAATEQYTYTFNNTWSPEIAKVTGDATYTAQFDSTVNEYTITWVIDGKSETETYEYGDTPVHADPTKAADAQYTYEFTGWTPAIATVTGDATYTAQFSSTVNEYTITWVIDGETETETYEYGDTPVHADPTKAADAQYTYEFTSWTPVIATVTGDATYTAQFSSTVNEYTITWVDGDGNILETDTVAYGDTPAYTGETPTKTATKQYTYTFNNTWSPEIAKVTGNATYTAQFDSTVNEYTVEFVDEDGTVLQSGKVAYGETPVYTGETPVKAADAQFTYSFNGWDNTPVAVTGDATYTATYLATVNSYTVVFKNYDGTELYKVTDLYGARLEYKGATPVKPADDQYTYTFTGWDNELTETIVADATYTAQFSSNVNEYTITWVDGDGNILETDTVAYGETPAYTGETPTKTATAEYTYTFAGWDPEVVAVTGDATYTAQFDSTVNEYTITWVIDGKLETETYKYGDTPVHADPTKEADAQYTYEFTGWTPAIATVTGDATYTAQFDSTVNEYTITWVIDGKSETQTYKYGATPVHADPTKEADAQYTYEFTGWTPAIATVTGDATYTAQFSSNVNEYTVTFKNEDGTVLQSGKVAYGTVPVYKGETPVKAADAQYTYTFAGWNSEVVAVTGDATYTAQFTAKANEYTLTVNTVYDDKVDSTVNTTEEFTYAYGSSYEIATPAKEGYELTTEGTLSGTMPAGNVTVTLTYTAKSYTVKVTYTSDDEKISETYEEALTYGESYKVVTPVKTGYTADKAEISGTVTGNVNETVEYTANKYSLTIKYQFTDGSEAAATYTSEVVYDTDYSVASPVIKGYTADEATVIGKMGAENVEVTVTYTVNSYKLTVNYVYENGTEAATTYTATLDFGEEYSVVSPEVTGHNPSRATVEGTMGAADETITVIYSKKTYTVIWQNEDGTVLETDENVPYYSVPKYNGATPTKTATAEYTYTFAGWEPSVSNITGDVTYKATYTATKNSYTITWKNDDGSVIDTTTVKYGEVPTHADATKNATAEYTYTFAGWDPEVVAVTGDAEYTAKFTAKANQYTITFDTDGGSVVAPITQDYATAVTAPAAPTKTGYTFAGWDVDVPATMPAGDMTIKAKWTVNQYTITFDTDGGNAIESITQDYGTAVTAPADPTKTGYTFAGWDAEIPATMPAEDVTITAKWTVNQYTITFDTDGGSDVAPITQNYATAVTAPAAPTKKGYTFAGWDAEIPATMPAENVTIKAKWTVNKYTITFDTDGGSEVAPITQDYATAVTAPAAPTKTGYTFAGWDAEIPATMPANDMTIKAKWTINKYTVTYSYNGTTATEEVEYKNSPVNVPSADELKAVAPEGQCFDKWVVNNGTTAVTPSSEVITEDTVFTAVYAADTNGDGTPDYRENAFKVTFTAGENGVLTGTTSYDVLAGLTTGAAPKAYANDGYCFDKWTVDGTEVADPAKYVITADTTFVAVFAEDSDADNVPDYEENKFTVTYVVGENGTTTDSVTITVVDGMAYSTDWEPNVTANEDFIFVEWAGVPDTVTEDVTITAVYAEDKNNDGIDDSTQYYTVTFINAAGETVSEKDYVYGTAASNIEVPANTANKYNAGGHFSYAWGELNAVTENVAYNEAETKAEHTYSKVVTLPTCTDEGYTTYTCTLDVCEHTYEDDVKPALGHKDEDKDHTCDNGCSVYQGVHEDKNSDHVCDYGCSEKIGEHKDSANDKDHVCDYGCGKVLEDCKDAENDGDHNCDICGKADVTAHTYADATCTVAKTCTECSATDGDPLGHDWAETTYAFSEDGKSCTATRVCNNDADHVETADATVTSKVKTPATCTVDGYTTYTATFDVDWAATQTKDVQDIPAINHDWAETTYSFAADGKSCTATRVCNNDAAHVENATATVTSKVKTPATCTVDGYTTYTATFAETWAEEQTLDVQDIPAINHDWAETTYSFAADGKSCTATRVCNNDAAHVENATATVTSKVKTPATCTVDGFTTYTATFAETWAEEQTLDVQDIPAINHDWAETTYSFAADGKSCTATRVCNNDAAHVENATATVTSKVKTPATCTVDGYTTYTATFAETWAEEQTLDVQDIDALGHDWSEWVLVKAPSAEEDGEYKRTCSRGDSTETKAVSLADYSKLEAAKAELNELLENDELTEEAKAAITDALDKIKAVEDNLPADVIENNKVIIEGKQDVIDSVTAEAENVIDDINNGIADGTMTKADTAELEKALEKLYDAVTNEIIPDVEVRDVIENAKDILEAVEIDNTPTKNEYQADIDSVKDVINTVLTKYDGCIKGEHSYDADITEPTCTEQGYTTHTCTVCGDSYVDSFVDALTHDWSEWALVKAPSAEEDGEYERTCSRGDITETKAVSLADYSELDAVKKDLEDLLENDELTEEAKKEITEALDKLEAVDDNLPADVTGENGEVIIPGSQNVIDSVVSELNKVVEDVENGIADGTLVKPDTSDIEDMLDKIGSAVENGIIPGAEVEEIVKEAEDIISDIENDADGASQNEYKDRIDATDKALSEVLDKYADCINGNHSYTDAVTAPTCTAQGYTTHSCDNCEYEYVDTYVAATGHNFDKANGVLSRPEKVGGVWTDGSYTYTCKNDASHKQVETVKRADYTDYDKLTDVMEELLEADIPAEDKAKIEAALENGLAQDLIVSEQDKVDAVAKDLNMVLEEVYPDAFSTLTINGAGSFFVGTVLDLKAIKEPVGVEATNVTWTSSDENVVFFSNGKLFAIGTGTVTLTAKSGILEASKTVNIVEGGNARGIRFVAMDKMHFIIEDYYVIFNSATLRWSDDHEIRFRVHIYQTFPFETYIVYINGQAVEPDADGYYTVTPGSGEVTVSVSGAMYDDNDGSGSGSKWSFWEWLLALIRKIINFFKGVFGIK